MRIERFNESEAMARAAAALLANAAQEAADQRGVFSLALAGGSTPKRLYEMLAGPPYLDALPWDKMHLFWGDERRVPPDQPDSNYRMVKSTLLDKAPLLPANLHPMPTGPAGAAQYQRELESFFRANGGQPSLDLVLLGMGGDGHTASLFPGGPALAETERWVVEAPAPQSVAPQVPRLSLTLPLINQARQVLFLVAGAAKRAMVERVLFSPGEQGEPPPAALVRSAGELIWFLAGGAAGLDQD